MTDHRKTYVLTCKQPWAWAIIHGGKNVENRTWKPRNPCRILIHAGRGLDPAGVLFLGMNGIRPPQVFASGVVIGAVDYTGWSTDSESVWAVPGMYHWALENPVPAGTYRPMRGQPSFFHPPEGWERSFPAVQPPLEIIHDAIVPIEGGKLRKMPGRRPRIMLSATEAVTALDAVMLLHKAMEKNLHNDRTSLPDIAALQKRLQDFCEGR
jgi:hypothetical protein